MTAARSVTFSFAAVVAASFVVLTFMGWQIRSNRHLAAQGREARQGLCALKNDLKVRANASRAFLRTHPNGIPGIPADVLRQSIRNQEATLRALERTRCGPV